MCEVERADRQLTTKHTSICLPPANRTFLLSSFSNFAPVCVTPLFFDAGSATARDDAARAPAPRATCAHIGGQSEQRPVQESREELAKHPSAFPHGRGPNIGPRAAPPPLANDHTVSGARGRNNRERCAQWLTRTAHSIVDMAKTTSCVDNDHF